MQIELSSLCNFDCKNCYRTKFKRETGHMELDLFKEIVEKIYKSEKLQNSLFLAGFGESMLNPHFYEMLKYAKRFGFYLMLPTNGSLINEKTAPYLRLVDQVQLSIDSVKRNEELRGGDVNPIKWVPLLREWRIPVQLNITINSRNRNEIYNFVKLSHQYGAPLYFMYSVPYFDKTPDLEKEYKYLVSETNELLTELNQYHVFKKVDRGCNTFKSCRYINHDFAIDWKGDMFPCNDAILSDYSLGNIKDWENLDHFIESSDLRKVASGESPLCRCCKFWDKYWDENWKGPEATYDKKLDYYYNLHKGKRCFILGNSITFTREIANLIRNEISIGSNLIAHAIDLYDGFRPTYATIGDADMILVETNRAFLDRLECPVFYPKSILDQRSRGAAFSYSAPITQDWNEETLKLLDDKIGVNYLNPTIGEGVGWARLVIKNPSVISLDLRKGVVESGTVIQQMSIPLAAYLGCNPIYLVGVDGEGHFYFHPEQRPYHFGPDVREQWSWYQMRLKEQGQIMYKLGNMKEKFLGIDNVTKEEVFNL